MQLPHWIRKSPKSRRQAISSADRRRRDELLIPLVVSRLEDRRVLSGSPVLTGANNLTAITLGGTNNGNTVTSLINGHTTPASGLGIAITGVNSGSGTLNGTWWYKVPAGSWTQFPTNLSSSKALLLDGADSVQFVPNEATGTASLTFLAWNEAGTDTSTIDVSTDVSAFSNAASPQTSSITVSAATLSTATTEVGTANLLDDQTVNPFANGTGSTSIIDADTNDLLTITITQKKGAAVDSGLTRGSLSGGGFTNNGDGTYTLTGVDAADATTAIQALTFTPTRGTAGTKLTTTFALSATDQFSQTAPASAAVAVTGNVTPVLNGALDFSAIPTNSTAVDGTQVGNLIQGKTVDTNDNSLGIAVTGLTGNVTDGQWEWSTDNSHWNDFSAVSAGSAFLLDNSDFLRFVPNTGFGGTATITFVAWDGTSGTHHSTADTTLAPGSGAFSSSSATSSITVYPAITISGTGTTNVLSGQTPAPFAGTTVTDPDTTDTVTITITQELSDGSTPDTLFANGALSSPNLAFTTDALGVYTFTGISEANATALLQSLVFTPSALTPGQSVTTDFKVVVSNSVSNLSTATDNNTSVVVTAPPLLTSVGNFPSIPAETNSNGIRVSALIDASPSTDGAAVVGTTDNGDGKWQYLPFGSTTWVDLPAVTTTSAFLLNSNDSIRFESTKGVATTATITLLAWDPADGGTAHTINDPTAIPGAYSMNSAMASISVYPALSISGTGTTNTQDDVTTNPFNNGSINATIGDTDPNETLTITITQQLSGGATDSTQANGALTSSDSFSGFVDNGDGTYTLTVVASNATTELQNLVFTPNPGAPGATADTTLQVQVADASAPVNTVMDSGTLLNTQSVTPPTLTGTNNLPPIAENASTNTDDPGTQVSNLPIGAGGSSGIAISMVDDANGTWQYSTNGTNWTPIPTNIGLTPPAPMQPMVFLLASTDYVRFLPNAGFTGSSTITYQAWDQVGHMPDQLANPTTRPFSRNLSPNTETASVTVFPVLTITGVQTTTSLDDQTSTPFNSTTIGDTITAETVTVTITQQQSVGGVATTDSALANGVLSGAGLTNNNNGTYTLTGTATQVTAALNALIFTPTLHEVADGLSVVTEFQIVVVDSGFAPVNTATDTGTELTVTANAAPVLPAGANNLPSIAENVSSAGDAGVLVSSLLSGKATDADGNPIGIAITQVENVIGGNVAGEWDYSTDGTHWTAITGVSGTMALLLAPGDYVRFLPAANFFGTASIQFLAWDQTVGSATGTIDPTLLPGSGAFSSLTANSSIQVVAPATITVTAPTQTTTDEAPIAVFAAAFAGQPGIADPNSPQQTYTITITQQKLAGVTDSTLQNGSLAGGGFTNNNDGTYTLSDVSASAATAALDALIFTPKVHQAAPGDSITTGFTITVDDGITAPPVSNNAVSVKATAINDPPTFVHTQTSPVNLAVLAPNGTTVGTDSATDVDHNSTITYAITGGNASGAYGIDASTGAISVVNSAALSFSSSIQALTISATNTGTNGVPSTVTNSTFSIALWEVTASATDITANSSTTLTVSLVSAAPSATAPLSPAPLSVPVSVSWDDGATSNATLTLAHPTVQLVHFFATNPNKTNPAAPIPITITGTNVNTQTMAAVAGTGVGFAVVPDSPPAFVEFVAPPALEAAPTVAPVDQPVTEAVDVGVAQSQATVVSDRSVMLRIISPLGEASAPIPVPESKLNDLPGLFKKLPDGHYQVFLSEGGHERLVIDVLVRQGRPVDSAEDSGGAGDRPPTGQTDTDKSNGLTDADPSATKGAAATALEKQPADNSAQPPNDGNQKNTLPSGTTPGATQSRPANPATVHGTPTAATNRGGHGSMWSKEWAELAATVAAAATAVAANSRQTDEVMEGLSKRSLSKSGRLSRWLRKSANVE